MILFLGITKCLGIIIMELNSGQNNNSIKYELRSKGNLTLEFKCDILNCDEDLLNLIKISYLLINS